MKKHKVQNAIIMAAGISSRFAPLSYHTHKGLITVKGEILIERQIRQLREAGIKEIIVVTGYKAEQFEYLKEKYGVILIYNPDYSLRNNNSSIHIARYYIGNSYICSVDNYFRMNPFKDEVEDSYYAAVYTPGTTKEWCLTEGNDGYINSVVVGGSDSWYMLGHTFWTKEFADNFFQIMDKIYNDSKTAELLWEGIYAQHLDKLKMKIKRYPDNVIFEFDTLDELREFDSSYLDNSRSDIIKGLADKLKVAERDLSHFEVILDDTKQVKGFSFKVGTYDYDYRYDDGSLNQRGKLQW